MQSKSNLSKEENKLIVVRNAYFKMIYVEGGTFLMGATPEQEEDAYIDEVPVHRVSLDSFYIGETVVTQHIWQIVMGNNPSNHKGDYFPVTNVGWDDCQEFIQKLNAMQDIQFRLPTEAEWEYSARGGVYHSLYKYAGGDNIDDVAWHKGNSGNKPHMVKCKKPNALGLYDMNGNVWEWCQDFSEEYTPEDQINPVVLRPCEHDSYRVYRGGSFTSNAKSSCRVSSRDDALPCPRLDLGFRLAFQI